MLYFEEIHYTVCPPEDLDPHDQGKKYLLELDFICHLVNVFVDIAGEFEKVVQVILQGAMDHGHINCRVTMYEKVVQAGHTFYFLGKLGGDNAGLPQLNYYLCVIVCLDAQIRQ